MTHNEKRGTILKGRYRLEGVSGSGGMSTVYLARDLQQGGRVAVKEDRHGEARILAGLRHPGIVRYLDSFSQHGRNWLVEEYVEGRTLSESVAEEGPLPETEAVFLALQLCSVLIYLQSRRPPVVYRDLKPENIMLKKEGEIRLIDFGIAREYVSGEDADTSGFGTIGYAAPEQFEGSRMQSDGRSDLYALGKVMFFLLTGWDPRELRKENWEDAVLSRVRSMSLAAWILRCTEEDPEQRPQSAEIAAYELKRMEREGNASERQSRGDPMGQRPRSAVMDTCELLQTDWNEMVPAESADSKRRRGEPMPEERKRKRTKTNPAAILLTILGILIYAGGFLFGLGKAFAAAARNGGDILWLEGAIFWGAAFLSGTLVMGLGQIIKLLQKISGALTGR